MLIVDWYHVPILVSLGFILLALAITIAASFFSHHAVEEVIDEKQGKTGSIFGSIQPRESRRRTVYFSARCKLRGIGLHRSRHAYLAPVC